MYEFLILAEVLEHPLPDFILAKIMNDMVGPFERLSNDQFSMQLTQLEQAQLIALQPELPEQNVEQRQRCYEITESGKKRLYELMMDTSRLQEGYYTYIFLYKGYFFDLLEPVERLDLIDHYTNYCQAQVFHQQQELDDLKLNARARHKNLNLEHLDIVLDVMQHAIDRWQLELGWIKTVRVRESEKTLIKQPSARGVQEH